MVGWNTLLGRCCAHTAGDVNKNICLQMGLNKLTFQYCYSFQIPEKSVLGKKTGATK